MVSGMDISCGCFSGAPGTFDALRIAWSQAAGYGVFDFRNQGGPIMPRLDFSTYSDEDCLGEWPNGAPDDPLIIVLVHAEKGGRIKVNHCPALADRLEELEGYLLKDGHTMLVLMTQQFIRGLRFATQHKMDVQFS